MNACRLTAQFTRPAERASRRSVESLNLPAALTSSVVRALWSCEAKTCMTAFVIRLVKIAFRSLSFFAALHSLNKTPSTDVLFLRKVRRMATSHAMSCLSRHYWSLFSTLLLLCGLCAHAWETKDQGSDCRPSSKVNDAGC